MNTKDIAGLAKFVAPSRGDGIPDSLKASSAGEKAEAAAVAELEGQEEQSADPAEENGTTESTKSLFANSSYIFDNTVFPLAKLGILIPNS